MNGHEFQLATDATAGEVVDALAQHLAVASGGSRETDRMYYDTFDA